MQREGSSLIDIARLNFPAISEQFDLDDCSMEHVAGPICGWARAKQTGERFAFDCQPVIGRLVWHWTLVPAPPSGDPRAALAAAAAAPSGKWISIIEDRRAESEPACHMRIIDNSQAKPMLPESRPLKT